MEIDHNKIITVLRNCDATMIPAGEKIVLIEGTHVRITQSLGGNFTILVNGNLVKVFGVQSLDFALTFRNIYTWTKYSGIDPETNLAGTSNVRGLDYFGNPQTRSLLFSMIVNL